MMDWKRNRESGGINPMDERPNLTPSEASGVGFDLLKGADRNRVRSTRLHVDSIQVVPDVQVRIGKLNAEHIDNLAAVLANGGTFKDALIVVAADYDQHGPVAPVVLADGFHRIAAHRLAYEQTDNTDMLYARVSVILDNDPVARAREISQTSNLTHGIGLSNAEKRERVLWPRVLEGHEWYTLSDSALARELGVARQTVRAWLVKLAALHPDNAFAQEAADRTQVRGADGNVYDIETIQQEAAKREYSQPQKTARAAVRNLIDAYDRLQRLGLTLSDDERAVFDRVARMLMDEFEITDDDL